MPFDRLPNEGQAMNGPFNVPSNGLKKQYCYGNRTRDLVIHHSKTNIMGQKMNYSNVEKNSVQNTVGERKNEVKEKRKPTVSKNSKPKQQVI